MFKLDNFKHKIVKNIIYVILTNMRLFHTKTTIPFLSRKLVFIIRRKKLLIFLSNNKSLKNKRPTADSYSG